MFSGIIEKTAKITSIEKGENSSTLRFATGFTGLEMGESVAVNGVCLTVAELIPGPLPPGDTVAFYVSPETLSRTSLRTATVGGRVNLERSLRMNARNSGHVVQGHVDGLAECTRLEEISGSWLLEFNLPASLARYTIEKGSIAIDGVSLTINSCTENRVGIMLIPHTWTHTRFQEIKVGDFVNIEVDATAKYIAKFVESYVAEYLEKSPKLPSPLNLSRSTP